MEQLRVQWTEFPTSLTGALGQLQHAGELADVTLACEGRHIHAHKLVLSACSPYFRDAFKENPCHHPIIILKDVQAQDILNLLSYMYHGEVNVEEDSLPSFIQTAELLQIKGLSTSVTLQSKTQTLKTNAPISFQVKKNILQTASKKTSSHQNNPPINAAKSDVQQKRRRNSASERLGDVQCHDTPKKTKPSKEKNSTPSNKKTDSSIPTTDNSITDTDKNDSHGLAPSTTPDNKSSDETDPIIKVEIKHEVDDVPDFEETVNDEPSEDSENTAPTSPPALYENSMLARSLLSGAQSLKTDPPIGKTKLGNQLTITNVTCRESTSVSTTPSSKFTISTDETVVKIERLSPRPEVMEIEPDVLISEQDDPSMTNRSLLSKNSGLAQSRDQAGTSSSQSAFNQNNHAAICGDCPHCGTKYSNQSALKYHVRLMHSDLTNRLCCHLCPRSFTMRDTFKEHMWTSHGQRN